MPGRFAPGRFAPGRFAPWTIRPVQWTFQPKLSVLGVSPCRSECTAHTDGRFAALTHVS